MNLDDRPTHRLARSVAIVSLAGLCLLACGSDAATTTGPTPTPSSVADNAPADAAPAGSVADTTPGDAGSAPDGSAGPGPEDVPEECLELLQIQVDLVIDQFEDVDLSGPARDVVGVFSEPPAGLDDSDAEYESLGCDDTPTEVEDELVESLLREQAPDVADLLYIRSEFESCGDALEVATSASADADAPLDLSFAQYLESTRAFVSASRLCEPDQVPVDVQEFYSRDE